MNTFAISNSQKILKCLSLIQQTDSLELGFATFFLNRTNFSGVLDAGPIGGYEQTGRYLINARYNKLDLTKKNQKNSSVFTKYFYIQFRHIRFYEANRKKEKENFHIL